LTKTTSVLNYGKLATVAPLHPFDLHELTGHASPPRRIRLPRQRSLGGTVTDTKRPPIPVLVVAGAYLAVGILGFVAHFHDLLAAPSEGIWMELTELLAVVAGVFLLRGRNWARWLAVAWIIFHVGLSAFDRMQGLVVHTVLAALIIWLLFRASSARWFRSPRAEPV
jgi:hypothetical protein